MHSSLKFLTNNGKFISNMSGWIGVDFDGTLAYYTKFQGDFIFGEVIEPMKQRILDWISKGRKVKIFTARVSTEDQRVNQAVALALQNWLEANGLPRLEITNIKDHHMDELWDDRAVQVVKNTGQPVGYSTRTDSLI